MNSSENDPELAKEPPQKPWKQVLTALGVTSIWLMLARYGLPFGAKYAPKALQMAVSWSTFRALTQFTILMLGIGLWRLLVPGGFSQLLGHPPSGRSALRVALVAPLIWSSIAWIALTIALPTLMEELRLRGPGASRQNAGAFAAELTSSSLSGALLWGVVLAALSEEFLFRGALWNLLNSLFNRLPGSPTIQEELGPTVVQRLQAGWVQGWGATLGAGLIFGLMHADMPGGVGIVRVVSTTCLGLAAGAVRTLSGSLAAAVLLHMIHNTISLGVSRGWFVKVGPTLYGVPAMILAASLLGTIALLTLAWRDRHNTALHHLR